MARKSKIEWLTDKDGNQGSTWNPVIGCSHVSEGCNNCYAERMAARFCQVGEPFEHTIGEFVEEEAAYIGKKWNGNAIFKPERLIIPFKYKRPRRIFVCSMGDLFHENITDKQIAAVYGAMAACPQHTFIIFTKRPERALEWYTNVVNIGGYPVGDPHPEALNCAYQLLRIAEPGGDGSIHCKYGPNNDAQWPLPNVWIGVSVENQAMADERIPVLMGVPAARRIVSIEPMLGRITLSDYLFCDQCKGGNEQWRGTYDDGSWASGGKGWRECDHIGYDTLDLVVCGAETGPGKRPMNIKWAIELMHECRDSNTAFFFKKDSEGNHELDGVVYEEWPE